MNQALSSTSPLSYAVQQALAVTLRGMTLGELKAGAERALVIKEASLGALNGAFTGVVAALGM